MSQYARVNSVVLLKSLKASLATFSDAAAVALDEVSTRAVAVIERLIDGDGLHRAFA